MSSASTFLSEEWVRNVVRAIEEAKNHDDDFSSITSGFTLSIALVVSDLSPGLKELYQGGEVAIFMTLTDGHLSDLFIGPSLPVDKEVDFLIKGKYDVAKKIFTGDLKPSVAFIRRQIRVEPLWKFYQDPKFTAKSIVAGNAVVRVIAKVPTLLPE